MTLEAAPRLVALSEALGLGADPAAVLGALDDVYAEVDREARARTEGLELPCRRGCDACCREAVFVSAPEFLAVARALLEEFPAAERARVLQQMEHLAKRFEDELELLETLTPGAERDEVAARVRFDCPLLGHDGACRVYAVRELNARTFGLGWDEAFARPFGCERTHARLAVLPPEVGPSLVGARSARRRLRERLPQAADVHVYPWWFSRYAAWLR